MRMCLCVCDREMERKREREKENERQKHILVSDRMLMKENPFFFKLWTHVVGSTHDYFK